MISSLAVLIDGVVFGIVLLGDQGLKKVRPETKYPILLIEILPFQYVLFGLYPMVRTGDRSK